MSTAETIPLQPVDSLTVTTLVDNVVDVFMPDLGPARRFDSFAPTPRRERARTLEPGETDQTLIAEHGFSALLAATTNGTTHRLLFDAGISPDGLMHNMRRLALDPRDVEAVVLSHGHLDHTTGLDGFARAVGLANLPVVIHPDFWNRRRITLPGREPWELPSTSRSALEGVGFEIIENRQPSFLFGGSVLITGEVDRTTTFERGFPIQEAFCDGRWQPDPLVLDDQAVITHVRGKGLVVITGCGHAGVVNTVRYAQRLTGVKQLYAVIGGFHLNGPLFEPSIPAVCAALRALAPAVVVPAHCTGWRATHALATAFPDSFAPNSVGTRLEL